MTSWQSFPNDIILSRDKVIVWQIPLNILTQEQISYWRILSADEKERANKFMFVKDKIRYIAGRGVLRILLGRYLDIPAKEVQILYEAKGKPFVDSELEFNLSNTQDMAVAAFNWSNIIGVDIEYAQKEIEFSKIAKRFFSPEESKLVINAKPEAQAQYFYNCWTRKEAFIKALGDGLSFPLDQFVVNCQPDVKARLLATKWNEEEVKLWMLEAFEIGEEFIGALAAKSPEMKVSYFLWKH